MQEMKKMVDCSQLILLLTLGLAEKVIAVESVIFAARQFVQFQHLLRCRDNQMVNIYYSEVRIILICSVKNLTFVLSFEEHKLQI